ncbi:hypothetical protein MKZ38_003780 [Zalerion maritima]|uniref:Uncharacterized protein n=1 Tax=Zalerion maritima TaxID=339359 RepID=A0AAD5WQF6_9PEZI|nr:hypothetical protein MKZ38_003780 [Zalerion maritima]
MDVAVGMNKKAGGRGENTPNILPQHGYISPPSPVATHSSAISPTPTAVSDMAPSMEEAMAAPNMGKGDRRSETTSPPPTTRGLATRASPYHLSMMPRNNVTWADNNNNNNIQENTKITDNTPATDAVEMDATLGALLVAELSSSMGRDVNLPQPGEVTWTSGNISVLPTFSAAAPGAVIDTSPQGEHAQIWSPSTTAVTASTRKDQLLELQKIEEEENGLRKKVESLQGGYRGCIGK